MRTKAMKLKSRHNGTLTRTNLNKFIFQLGPTEKPTRDLHILRLQCKLLGHRGCKLIIYKEKWQKIQNFIYRNVMHAFKNTCDHKEL